MNRRPLERGVSALVAALAAWPLAASVAHACPMCFNGNNMNQAAFLYGSLFLMIVPVTAIGSLLYWAHRRYKALDAHDAAPVPELRPGDPEQGPALHVIRR